MQIIKASEITTPTLRCVVYAQAGMGKTSIAKILNKKTLVIDVDRSTIVLKGAPNIDIIYLEENLSNLKECVEFIQNNAKKYELVFFDNVSQLEKNMLTVFGDKGKNDGVPAQSDYQRMQFKIYDYIKKILMCETNVIITAWEIIGNTVNSDTGECGLRLEPQMNNKILNYVLGLCNTVAHYEKKTLEDGTDKRYLRLASSKSCYAKDQIQGRAYCELEDLICS
jgi:phage nucleotide-binding protein